MALRGGLRQPPYLVARGLASWAQAHEGYLRGRLLLAGTDPDTLDAFTWLDITEATIVDSAGAGYNVSEIIERLHAAILEAQPVRETWGTLPSQVESAAAAENMFGPRPSR